jgi:plasmid stabilization system protein ParE
VRRVRFAAAARREFLAEVIYYNKERAGLGARFTAAVEEATARAAAFPLTGSPASKSTLRVFVRDFPFAVVYRPTKDEIIVFALAHHSRRPGYWLSRVQDR